MLLSGKDHRSNECQNLAVCFMVFPLIVLITCLSRPQGPSPTVLASGGVEQSPLLLGTPLTTLVPVSSAPLSSQRLRGGGTGTLGREWDIPTGTSLALASVVIAPPRRTTEKRQRRNLGSRESQISPELWCPPWERGLHLRSLWLPGAAGQLCGRNPEVSGPPMICLQLKGGWGHLS